MDNPFSLLGIDDKRIDIETAVAALEEKIAELNVLEGFYKENFRKRYFAFYSNNLYAIRKSKDDDIRDFYEERYMLELPLDKKYFTEQEFYAVVEQSQRFDRKAIEIEREIEELNGKKTPEAQKQIKELRDKADFYKTRAKIFNQSVKEQSTTIREEKNKITQILGLYKSNPNDSYARARIEDLYVRLKFEKAFKNLSLQSPIDVKNHKVFREALESHSGYRSLIDAYNKVATVEAREDLVSELYVTKRIANPVGAISETEARKITIAEAKYHSEFVDDLLKSEQQREMEQAAENQNHKYGWGIILTNPFYLLKDEPIDTPVFKGKITVEDIGRFTEESFFRKVKMKNEQRNRRRKNTEIKGVKKAIFEFLGRTFELSSRKKDSDEVENEMYMRDYYYSYRATKRLYDEIYKVTKTDSEGRARTQIVFSPITQQSLGKDVSVDFLKNVYFSDYMLDLAKQNGGYAGEVFPAKNGGYNIYNYHPNCQEQIGATILFDRGFKGSISDRRDGRKDEYLKATKDDFLKLLSRKKERIIGVDE